MTASEEVLDPERILLEYREALGFLESRRTHVQVEAVDRHTAYVTTASSNEPVEQESATSLAYIMSGGAEKLSFSKDTASGYLDRVVVSDGNRGFLLRRNSPGDSYYLEDDSLGDSPETNFQNERGLIAFCEFGVAGRTDWPSKVRSPGFQVTRAIRETVGGKGLYRIEFRCDDAQSAPTPRAKLFDQHEGWFRVDPAAGWVLQDYELRSRRAPKASDARASNLRSVSTGSIQYRQGDGLGTLVPSRISYQRTVGVPERTQTQSDVFEIKKWSTEPASPDEFSLAFYGLGDFENPNRPSRAPASLWLVGFGVACLLISTVLSWMVWSRRRTAFKTGDG